MVTVYSPTGFAGDGDWDGYWNKRRDAQDAATLRTIGEHFRAHPPSEEVHHPRINTSSIVIGGLMAFSAASLMYSAYKAHKERAAQSGLADRLAAARAAKAQRAASRPAPKPAPRPAALIAAHFRTHSAAARGVKGKAKGPKKPGRHNNQYTKGRM